MRTRCSVLKSAAAGLALAALVFVASPRVEAANPHDIAGTWVTWATIAPGVQVPILQTFSVDGTFVASDVSMFGGLPGVMIRATPLHGVWELDRRDMVTTTGLAMIYDASTSLLAGFIRSRAIGTIDRTGEGEGTVTVEFLPCPTPLTCPDPLSPDATWVPAPGFPPSMTFTTRRLQPME